MKKLFIAVSLLTASYTASADQCINEVSFITDVVLKSLHSGANYEAFSQSVISGLPTKTEKDFIGKIMDTTHDFYKTGQSYNPEALFHFLNNYVTSCYARYS